MFKILKDRSVQLGIICILGLSLLIGQLAYLTVEEGDTLYMESLIKKRVELKVKGTRGVILDRHGIPMAINRQTYAIQLDRQQLPSDHALVNKMLHDLLIILYNNGDENALINQAPIRIDPKDSSMYYTWKDEDDETQDKRYKGWCEAIGVKEDLDAEEMFMHLRDQRYEVNPEIDDQLALNIISIRLNIYMKRFTQYDPIPVADGIGLESVVQLETFAAEMHGLQTLVGSGRYYPLGSDMAQIVGYLGSIDKGEIEEYAELGYDIAGDMVGRAGVEAYGESIITGNRIENQGKLIAEKDSLGKIVKILDEEKPENGNNIVLTIDSEFQTSVSKILEEGIYNMRDGLPPYDDEKSIAPLAEEGACVVLDIKTGEIISMVSYPSFDPNSPTKEGKQFSLAYQGSIIPGSVFKMLVGIAGLMEGVVTLDETIYDEYEYTKYDTRNPPHCNRYPGHGFENYEDALKHSCNYYFYEVADRLGVDPITKWSKLFGLDGGTGIEILSAEKDKNIIPDESVKSSYERNNMRILINEIMRRYGFFGTILTEKQKEDVEKIIDFPLSSDRSKEAAMADVKELTNLLKSMGYTEKTNYAADEIRRDVLANLKRWRASDTINVGIGQGYTAMSPLSIARYIAAIANGGKVLETHVVKSIIDENGNIIEDIEPKVIRELGIDQEYLDATLRGMWKVVNDPLPTRGEDDGGGMAVKYFEDMDPDIVVAGKTGTAQTVPTDEFKNNAWFTAITPYEDPEIAVVVVIQNGRTSGNATPIARRVIEEYYRLKDYRQSDGLNAG